MNGEILSIETAKKLKDQEEEIEKLNKENKILNSRIKKAINILDRYGTSSYETVDLLYSALRGNEE